MKQRTIRTRGGYTAVGALLCAAVLLAASLVESAHFCELRGSATVAQRGSAQPKKSAPEFCLICATAHQASMRAATAWLAPSQTMFAAECVVAAQPHSRLQVFSRYVRPPPAA